MNRIFPEQLASNLNSHLAKVYFLVGTDPLLLSESEDLIHQAALLQGFDEKNQITIDTNTDWPTLIEASQSMGLFFNKQIFILNLPENLTALLQKNLQQFISGLNEDSLLVLTLPVDCFHSCNKAIEWLPHQLIIPYFLYDASPNEKVVLSSVFGSSR